MQVTTPFSFGSGFIIKNEGVIVTCYHIIKGCNNVVVSGRRLPKTTLKVLYTDKLYDLAFLENPLNDKDINVPNLSSSSISEGNRVYAIGHPMKLKYTTTTGVISSVSRDFKGVSFIQIDMPMNPGNSGGPLINILGEAIGMNTFIFSESGGSIGVGFAIPINRVKMITEEIIEYGRRRQIWFGFRIQDLNPMIASYLQLEDLNGVIVSYVDDNSPAVAAGLRRGDIIVRINQHQINNANEAEIATLEFSIGDEIELEIIRNTRGEIIRFPAVESQ